MEQGDSEDSRYITKHCVKTIWNDLRLKEFCRIVDIEEHEEESVKHIKNELLQTLSILVSIRWNEWHRFRNIFLGLQYDKRKDKNIKNYRREDLAAKDFLRTRDSAGAFFRIRDAFIPIPIKQGMVKVYKKGRRLPFVDLEQNEIELGVGGYGTVTKATIAKWQYQVDGRPQSVSYIGFEIF